MKLSEIANGRDNNFNLIRFTAAFSVLFSHCFALVYGSGDAEPLRISHGVTLGTIAVDVFFITSGFLVTNSLFSRKSLSEFICARFLRIYPALILMVLLCVIVLGASFTTLSLTDYFTSRETLVFLAKNSSLAGTSFNLPGVFETNPYKNVVNGSLWTLPCEVGMYFTLVMIWFVFQNQLKQGEFLLRNLIVFLAVLSLFFLLSNHFFLHLEKQLGEHLGKQPAQLFFMFYCGAAFFALKDRIQMTNVLFWILAIVLAASLFHREVFFVSYTLTLGYLVFFLAYIPSGRIRLFNRLGDYSYGIYIYAYPVQQSIVALRPQAGVFEVFLLSSVITISLAALSWHFLERIALDYKSYLNIKVATLFKL